MANNRYTASLRGGSKAPADPPRKRHSGSAWRKEREITAKLTHVINTGVAIGLPYSAEFEGKSMLKRSIAALQQWLSPGSTADRPHSREQNKILTARRGFFKKSAIGAVSITGTAGLAKVVIDATEKPDTQKLYVKDGLAGEQELREREYVPMSDQEKTEMIEAFVDNYSKQS